MEGLQIYTNAAWQVLTQDECQDISGGWKWLDQVGYVIGVDLAVAVYVTSKVADQLNKVIIGSLGRN